MNLLFISIGYKPFAGLFSNFLDHQKTIQGQWYHHGIAGINKVGVDCF